MLGEVIINKGLVRFANIFLLAVGMVVALWLVIRWRPSR
jgi:hypothetical protein